MKSNELMHAIIERFGSEDNRDLMRALKAFRLQVMKEAQDTQSNANKYLKLKYR